jgi:hypothetical protein
MAAINSGSPAVYRIAVQGRLDPTLSDYLGGMRIETRESRGTPNESVAILVGRLADQAQLLGVVNALYEMHFPILAVERLP